VVRLPLATFVKRHGNGVSRPSHGERAPLPVRKILVVDDTQIAVIHAEGVAGNSSGKKVSRQLMAATALEIVAKEQPDVVISDIGTARDGWF